MANDLKTLEEKIVSKRENELNRVKSTLKELMSTYGDYTIKVERISTESLVNQVKHLLLDPEEKVKVIHEFSDLRHTISPNKRNPEEFSHISLKIIYNPPNNDFNFEGGKRITLPKNKNFAKIICFNDKVLVVTVNREALLITNEEFANSIRFLIDIVYNNKTIDV